MTILEIQQAVADDAGIPMAKLKGSRGVEYVANARQLAVLLTYDVYRGAESNEIGPHFNRTGSAIRHSLLKARNRLDVDAKFARKVEAMREKLGIGQNNGCAHHETR